MLVGIILQLLLFQGSSSVVNMPLLFYSVRMSCQSKTKPFTMQPQASKGNDNRLLTQSSENEKEDIEKL